MTNKLNKVTNIDKSDEVKASEVFNIDTDLIVSKFIERSSYVPEIDDSYVFDQQTTIAILLGLKFNNLLVKPASIISRVLYPQMAISKNPEVLKKIVLRILILMILVIVLFNLFLEPIVGYFLNENINLLPFRLFSLASLFLSISTLIASNGILILDEIRIF